MAIIYNNEMMYILTQEELDELKSKKALDFKMKADKLQKLCTEIADKMPVVWGWGNYDGVTDPKPWGCILSRDDKREWYCDKCPVTDICPYPNKHWSK